MKLPGAKQGGPTGVPSPRANLSEAQGQKQLGQSLTQLGMAVASVAKVRNKTQMTEATYAMGTRAAEEMMPFTDEFVDASALSSELRGDRTGNMLGAEAQYLHFNANSDAWIQEAASRIADKDVREHWIIKQQASVEADKLKLADAYTDALYKQNKEMSLHLIDQYSRQGEYGLAREQIENLADPVDRAEQGLIVTTAEQVGYGNQSIEAARATGSTKQLWKDIEAYETGKRGGDLDPVTRVNLESKMRSAAAQIDNMGQATSDHNKALLLDDMQAFTYLKGKPLPPGSEQTFAEVEARMQAGEKGYEDAYYDARRSVEVSKAVSRVLQKGNRKDVSDAIDVAISGKDASAAGLVPEVRPGEERLWSDVQFTKANYEIQSAVNSFYSGLDSDFVGTLREYGQDLMIERIDFDNTTDEELAQALASRQDALGALKIQWSTSHSTDFLDDQEAAQFRNRQKYQTPQEAFADIAMFRQVLGADGVAALYNDIGDNNWPSVYTVGADLYAQGTAESISVADKVAYGNQLAMGTNGDASQLKTWIDDPGKFYKQSNELFAQIFNGRIDQMQDYSEALKGLWIANAVERGSSPNVNTSTVKKAAMELIGGFGKLNGQYVRTPKYGMDFDDFEKWVDNMDASVIDAAGGAPGQGIYNTSEQIAEAIRDGDLVLVNSPDARNKYVVVKKDGHVRGTVSNDYNSRLTITYEE